MKNGAAEYYKDYFVDIYAFTKQKFEKNEIETEIVEIENNKVIIDVMDDGQGFNLEKIKNYKNIFGGNYYELSC